MKAIFLTSNLGCYKKISNDNGSTKIAIKCNNSNKFMDKLKDVCPIIETLSIVASNPDNFNKTKEYANILMQSLTLDNYDIKKLNIIDHKFSGNIEKAILSSQLVVLSGGSVPKQNKYFQDINLAFILKKYEGVLIGQSAGSMNCSTTVYTQPETIDEFNDSNYERIITGLGLTDITIMPHMNKADTAELPNQPTIMQMCLADSYNIPHYGICDYGFIEIINNKATAYGKTLYLKDGKCTILCSDHEHVNL